jgi:hypothetical protein
MIGCHQRHPGARAFLGRGGRGGRERTCTAGDVAAAGGWVRSQSGLPKLVLRPWIWGAASGGGRAVGRRRAQRGLQGGCGCSARPADRRRRQQRRQQQAQAAAHVEQVLDGHCEARQRALAGARDVEPRQHVGVERVACGGAALLRAWPGCAPGSGSARGAHPRQVLLRTPSVGRSRGRGERGCCARTGAGRAVCSGGALGVRGVVCQRARRAVCDDTTNQQVEWFGVLRCKRAVRACGRGSDGGGGGGGLSAHERWRVRRWGTLLAGLCYLVGLCWCARAKARLVGFANPRVKAAQQARISQVSVGRSRPLFSRGMPS